MQSLHTYETEKELNEYFDIHNGECACFLYTWARCYAGIHCRVAQTRSVRNERGPAEANHWGACSKPSKMPGYSYNLPAIHCKTGSKLAQIPGTTCHGCYALKGRYRFPNVMDAMMRRLASITRPDWARTMAADINARKSRWFRWHDSGDIQSVKHLLKIFHVCRLTPDVAHWIPTREAGLLSKIPADRVPPNLTIR
jgi:hypothetical protein